MAARRPPRHRTSRGFTLIEVLAALVIVSLGMLGVIQAVSQTASNSAYLRDKTFAHWIALNRLTEVRLQPAAPAAEKTSGEVEFANRRWRWTLTVTDTAVASMQRLDMRVALADQPAPPSNGADAGPAPALATVTGFYGSAVAAPGVVRIVWDPTPGESGGDAATDGSGDGAPSEPSGEGEGSGP